VAQISLHRPWAPDSWTDLDRLRHEMDALFSRVASPSPLTRGWRGVFPAVNLYESSDGYALTAELPGVEPEDLHVSLEGSTLRLEGQRKSEEQSDGVSVHRRERQAGSFKRAFELPGEVDAEKVEAVHRDGILLLRLPKVPEAQPRQIAVEVG